MHVGLSTNMSGLEMVGVGYGVASIFVKGVNGAGDLFSSWKASKRSVDEDCRDWRVKVVFHGNVVKHY